MIKAYEVFDRQRYEPYSIIVFAESRGKAVSLGYGTEEYPTCDWDFTQLTAHRSPAFDKYYAEGKWRMEWEDDADRIAMIECGYYCDDDSFDPDYCESCSGKDICPKYEEYLEEEAEEDGEQDDT